jgi:hypothetical protein
VALCVIDGVPPNFWSRRTCRRTEAKASTAEDDPEQPFPSALAKLQIQRLVLHRSFAQKMS